MKFLEPRKYDENEIIYEELQEVLEITFVMTGTFYVGYEINKIVKMKIQLPPGTSFGAFNCCFLKRCMFIYKCKNPMTGFAMRRNNWQELAEQFPSKRSKTLHEPAFGNDT